MPNTFLVWCDLETLGDNSSPKEDHILEVALSASPVRWDPSTPMVDLTQVVNLGRYHDRLISEMDPYVQAMHTKNGLLRESAAAEVEIEDADEAFADMLSDQLVLGLGRESGDQVLLAGTGVAQFDLHRIRAQMPNVARLIHEYRTIDVGHFRRIMKVLYPQTFADAWPKPEEHRALPDLVHARETWTKIWRGMDPAIAAQGQIYGHLDLASAWGL